MQISDIVTEFDYCRGLLTRCCRKVCLWERSAPVEYVLALCFIMFKILNKILKERTKTWSVYN